MEETNPVGRPLEYSEETIKLANEYLSACIDTDGDRDIGVKAKVKVPTKGGLAVHLHVSRETLYDWARKYPEFSDIMEQMGAIQEERLINNGLSGDYNPTIAKVLLTKHGYTDKTDITSGEKPINGNTIIFRDFGESDATGS